MSSQSMIAQLFQFLSCFISIGSFAQSFDANTSIHLHLIIPSLHVYFTKMKTLICTESLIDVTRVGQKAFLAIALTFLWCISLLKIQQIVISYQLLPLKADS